jgi:hypothetical protein
MTWLLGAYDTSDAARDLLPATSGKAQLKVPYSPDLGQTVVRMGVTEWRRSVEELSKLLMD